MSDEAHLVRTLIYQAGIQVIWRILPPATRRYGLPPIFVRL